MTTCATGIDSWPGSVEARRTRLRPLAALAGTVLFVAGVGSGATLSTRLDPHGPAVVSDCGPSSAPRVRTTLYFGLQRPNGGVTELEWQLFLREQVTRQFPAGLTAWEAEGQWQAPDGTIDRERSKVLLLVHPDTAAARLAVQSLIEAYRQGFDQQSVLWESSRVCVTS